MKINRTTFFTDRQNEDGDIDKAIMVKTVRKMLGLRDEAKNDVKRNRRDKEEERITQTEAVQKRRTKNQGKE